MKRTKIVATLGPASNKLEVLREMIVGGLNIARLNFSHGAPDEKKAIANTIREAAKAEGKVVGILADLQGPKIRIAKFKGNKINLSVGDAFTLDASLGREDGDLNVVGIDYKELPNDLDPGDILLLDDGRIVLEVEKIEASKIMCRVTVGGELSNNKGINRQGGGLSAGALTDKDRADIKTAVAIDADYVAISFVRSKEDVLEAKQLIKEAGGRAGVIPKIERIEAMVPETLREIIAASDGIMIARGDLGVEIGIAEVPAAQKLMTNYCRELHKPVITATQMMETMIHNQIPTRAEISDVANAILDGTDTVMLSAETATGDHPALVIKTVSQVCFATEKNFSALSLLNKEYDNVCYENIDEAVAKASMSLVNCLKIDAVISFTETGKTPLWLSRNMSEAPIYGFSRNRIALGQMALYRDVFPIDFDVTKYDNNAELKKAAIAKLEEARLVRKGDTVLITYGDHIGVMGQTNSITVLKVE
jgi:pyruvate kinase